MSNERINGYNRDYYHKNLEKIRERKCKLMKKYRDENPEKYRRQSREHKAKTRAELFEMYGYECADCGFTDKRALTLDHIKNNGSEERKKLGERGVYRRALEKKREKEYQILCMNCQFIKRHV